MFGTLGATETINMTAEHGAGEGDRENRVSQGLHCVWPLHPTQTRVPVARLVFMERAHRDLCVAGERLGCGVQVAII